MIRDLSAMPGWAEGLVHLDAAVARSAATDRIVGFVPYGGFKAPGVCQKASAQGHCCEQKAPVDVEEADSGAATSVTAA